MGALRYSCPIRLVPTYILPAKEIRLLGKFRADSFKTERLVCVERDGQKDLARSTRLVRLIKNIYTLWGRKRLLHCVASFWLKSLYPLQGYKIDFALRGTSVALRKIHLFADNENGRQLFARSDILINALEIFLWHLILQFCRNCLNQYVLENI